MTSKQDRLTRVANAALILVFAVSVKAANVETAVPSPAAIAAGIDAHLASVPAGSDPAALLSVVQQRLASPEATTAEIDAGLSLIGAVTDAEKSSSLELYLGSNKGTAKAVDAVFAAVQRDPVALKKWVTARKLLEAKLDGSRMAAIWDGSAVAAASAADAVVAAEPLRDAVAQPRLAAPTPELAPQAARRAAPPSPAGSALDSLLTAKPAAAAAVEMPRLSAEEEAKVGDYINTLMTATPEDLASEKRSSLTREAKGFGAAIQKEAAQRSQLLKKPLAELSGSPVSENLQHQMTELQDKVKGLDPSRVTMEGLISKLARQIPFIGSRLATPIEDYMRNAQTAEKAIETIQRSLEAGRDTLIEDNNQLETDQQRMRILTKKLNGYIAVARRIDAELGKRIAAGGIDAEKKKFLEEEVLFTLRQRTIDLQQQLAVNQQGVIAAGLLINNNETLINSVNRAILTIPRALEVSASIAIALKDQQAVLDATNAVNETVGNLITANAKALKEQGTKIHEQAVTAGIDVEKFRAAYEDLNAAITEIARFKQEALPQMKAQIDRFAELNISGEKSIQRMEQAVGHRASLLDKLEFRGDAGPTSK